MGIIKKVKKAAKRGARMQAKFLRTTAPIVNMFVPGLGTVSEPVAKLYDKLGAEKKRKFHKAKTKAAKMKILKGK